MPEMTVVVTFDVLPGPDQLMTGLGAETAAERLIFSAFEENGWRVREVVVDVTG